MRVKKAGWRAGVWLALWLVACRAATAEMAIYEVPDIGDHAVGAWDVNILADDVQFAAPAILRQIRMPIAIAGEQECKLWIFEDLNEPPIWTSLFTNMPAVNQHNVTTYIFDLHLQVPRRIYVGFSAQGGGWTGNMTDYWARGSNVVRGVAGTPGVYYFGPVAGERLTTSFAAGDLSFGRLQIYATPARISAVAREEGELIFSIEDLPIHATNAVERAEIADGSNWAVVTTLPAGASNHVWRSGPTEASTSFYRISSQ